MKPGHINANRFLADFEALSAIGATEAGGVHRPAHSPAHLEARAWFRQRCNEAGLESRVDAAGNHWATHDCGAADAPTLVIGSHLDSVPNGGRFDGALGVLAGLEVLRSLRDLDYRLPFSVAVVDFTDEEGAYIGLMGSRAATGKLHAADLTAAMDQHPGFKQALRLSRIDETAILDAHTHLPDLCGYLELHIEQGPRLDLAGMDIGVVTGIVGIRWHRVTFTGRADHAGTTPMAMRRDASQGAAMFMLKVRERVLRDFPGCVANTGTVTFSPGAFNVVPAIAEVALECRAPNSETLSALRHALLDEARQAAGAFGLGLDVAELESISPALMDTAMQAMLTGAAEALDLTYQTMPSGAGHDAQSFADICPTGMVFVPSIGGRSHCPEESTLWQDCINGANVLLNTVLVLAQKGTRDGKGT